MKKLIKILTLTLVLSLIGQVPVFAASDAIDGSKSNFTISEYDTLVELRANPKEELIENGFDENAIQAVEQNAAELELLRRAQLSEETLKNEYYYTDEQIQILKEYEGTPIESTPELKAVLATCTGTFSVVSYSASSISAKINWTWSTAPVLSGTGVYDTVAVRWQGTNTAGAPLNVALNNSISKSYHKINYQNLGVVTPVKRLLTVNDVYGKAYDSFQLSSSSGYGFAKTGEMQICVDRTGTDSIKEIAVCFSYGHTNIKAPVVTWPVSFSIEFQSGADQMFKYTKRVLSNGTVYNY
jgi:hypothetical protein